VKKYSLIWLTCSVLVATYIIVILLTYFIIDENIALALITGIFSKEFLFNSLTDPSVLLFLSFLSIAIYKKRNQDNGDESLSDEYANPTDNFNVGFKKIFYNTEYKNLRIFIIFSTMIGLLLSFGFFIYFT
jgi:hypothetical protein